MTGTEQPEDGKPHARRRCGGYADHKNHHWLKLRWPQMVGYWAALCRLTPCSEGKKRVAAGADLRVTLVISTVRSTTFQLDLSLFDWTLYLQRSIRHRGRSLACTRHYFDLGTRSQWVTVTGHALFRPARCRCEGNKVQDVWDYRPGCLCFDLCGPYQCSADTGTDTWKKQALSHAWVANTCKTSEDTFPRQTSETMLSSLTTINANLVV